MIGNVKYISLSDLEDTEGHCIQCIRDIPMIILTGRCVTPAWSVYRDWLLYTDQSRYSDWSVCSDKFLYCIPNKVLLYNVDVSSGVFLSNHQGITPRISEDHFL